MRHMSIVEFKATIDSLAERYPDARVDFIYPKAHGAQARVKWGNMTGYDVLLDSGADDKAILRIIIDHARGQQVTP